MKLSENFNLNEFCKSETAIENDIKNLPDDKKMINIMLLVGNVMQPLRTHLKRPIRITSGFRNILVNYLIKGSDTSDHVQGKACDFKCDNMADAFEFIKNNLNYDQLIWEFGDDISPDWIHVSYRSQNNRMQVLIATKENGSTRYIRI